MVSLPELMHSKPTLMASGAYNGLTARLVENAGFDALWASGFSISASMALPDANVITASELVRTVDEMVNSVAIPVIVDCDEGYGALPGTLRLVQQLWKAGAQGICVEDNTYPKVNSFFTAREHLLIHKQHFADKVSAIKQAVPEMMVIARTEALIADLSLDEAIDRGVFYAEHGADCVVLHSRYSELAQYEVMMKSWPCDVPLVVIPTMAPGIKFTDFARLGYKIVIFANQVLRANVLVTEQILQLLHTHGDLSLVQDRLASMQHIFDLAGQI